jgi:mannose-6-phosphate isomerase-like protein (cupin superfamily)
MCSKAFVITGDSVATIANDVTDFRYRAISHFVPVGVQAAARSAERVETQFMVAIGTVEFMIGGATAIAFAGDFVRVPPGIIYAWRNAGDTPAHILMRSVSPAPLQRAMRVRVDFAA